MLTKINAAKSYAFKLSCSPLPSAASPPPASQGDSALRQKVKILESQQGSILCWQEAATCQLPGSGWADW